MATAPKPPGPANPPLIGHLGPFRRDPLSFLQRVAHDYGDIAHFRLGPQRIYLLNHPNLVRDVLVTRQSNFRKSRVLQRAKVLLGEGLLTSEDPLHLRQRRLVQPAFHRERLMHYAETMVECGLRASARWQDGGTLDLHEEMMCLTLAIVARTLFSADVEQDAAEIGAAMTEVLKLFKMILLPYSELLQKLPLPSTRRLQRARAVLDRAIYRIIHERRASGEDRGDLLSMLLLAQDEDSSGMSDTLVRDEALTLFLAGHETTANALMWSWYLLSENPECEARLQHEVDTVLAGRRPTFDDVPELPYTEMVLAEALRLFPPAWAVGRLVKEEFVANGFPITPGSVCLLSPWVTHRDQRWYPQPLRFDPERWTPEKREARPKFSYFPFGGGARVCIGERFAWMEGVLLLATIAQRWKLRLVPDHPVETLALITLRSKYGMRMTAHSRM